MRFIVNKIDTKKWEEVEKETLLDWAKQEGGTDQKKVVSDMKLWLGNANNGEVYTFGVNRIVAISLQ